MIKDDEQTIQVTGSEEKDNVTFVEVSADNPVTKIQSLCVNCGENGWTTFLLTSIPHFRELIISSFSCPFCGDQNNSIQYGGIIQDKGVRYSLRIKSKEDLDRQIIKSDYASIKIQEIDLEIPPETQKGSLNTIEGVLMQTYDSIDHLQPLRRVQEPLAAEKLDEFLKKLKACMNVEFPFVITLDDYSGNSFIENPLAPQEDPEMIVYHYTRSQEQDYRLGIDPAIEKRKKDLERENQKIAIEERKKVGNERKVEGEIKEGEFVRIPGSDASALQSTDNLKTLQEVLNSQEIDERIISFEVQCSACPAIGIQRMVNVNIPYFKEVVVMAFHCSNCGYKNSEIKTGGAISSHGKKITLHVENPIDLSRDVLKSESATLIIPELELHVQYGSMGGKFTTVEGVLNNIKDDMSKNPFIVGDSSSQSAKERFNEFLGRIKDFMSLKEKFTLIIDDPVANSYIQNIFWPEPDNQLVIEDYERTYEQNEELGLNDINTENYIDNVQNPEEVYGRVENNAKTEEDILDPHGPKGKKD